VAGHLPGDSRGAGQGAAWGGKGPGAGREFPGAYVVAAGCIRPAAAPRHDLDGPARRSGIRTAHRIAGAEEIHRITGNRPDEFYVAARLLWLRDHEPEVLRQTAKFVQVNGYINYRLTGRIGMDPAHAVLLQMRNYATGEWSQALCLACGVDPAQFPEVLEAHAVQGEVTVEAAQATGLRVARGDAGSVDSATAALEVGGSSPALPPK